jgi:hypothetical protein
MLLRKNLVCIDVLQDYLYVILLKEDFIILYDFGLGFMTSLPQFIWD